LITEQHEEDFIRLCGIENQKWILLYRGTQDGFDAEKFHENCDGKHNTLTIIMSSSLNIFGGFTGAAWSQSESFTSDPCAFIFSLQNKINKPLLIRCSEESEAIYCSGAYGPCFGNDDIKISDKCNKNQESLVDLCSSYEHDDLEFGSKETKSFLAGSFNFRVKEIEVYCKDYEPLLSVIKTYIL
jgi:hypothetical protein